MSRPTPEELDHWRFTESCATKAPWRSLPKPTTLVGVHGPDCKIYHQALDPDSIEETHMRQRADAVLIPMMRNAWSRVLDAMESEYIRADTWRDAAMAMVELIEWDDPDEAEHHYSAAKKLLDAAASLER